MYRRILLLASLGTAFLFLTLGCTNEPQKKPLDNQEETAAYTTLFEEAADNPHENGCVSCHKKTQEIDRSLSTYVKRISGHPAVKEGTVSACYECHEAQKDYQLYKKFYQGMHQSHWLSETFYSKNEGDCYSCHTVEKNGVSGIKDYPLAGYRDLGGKSEQKAKEEAKPSSEKRTTEPKEEVKEQKEKPQEEPELNQEPEQTQETEQGQQQQGETDEGLPSDGPLELMPTPGP